MVRSTVKLSIFGSSSIGLLNRLVAIHVFGTLLAYLVYVRFAQLGDGYGPEYYEIYANKTEGLTSTLLTFFVYAKLGSVLPGFLAPMAIGILIAIVTWFTFRDVYNYLSRKLFWTCNLFPIF